MKLLILLLLITSNLYSQEIEFNKNIKSINSEYKTYQIIEIEQQRIQEEMKAVALNKLEIKEGRYWVDGRWIQRKNSNYKRINNQWFYQDK